MILFFCKSLEEIVINIESAIKAFKEYIEQFNNEEEAGFDLKEKHTYGVMKRSKK